MATQKPAHNIRLGRIEASIWANRTENNEFWFNVTVKRRFNINGEWKDATTFGRDDLPIVSKVLDMAYSWIWEHPVSTNPNSHRQANANLK